jgi:hypothetical protein
MEKGSESSGALTLGEAKWDYTLKIDQEGIRSATWSKTGVVSDEK